MLGVIGQENNLCSIINKIQIGHKSSKSSESVRVKMMKNFTDRVVVNVFIDCDTIKLPNGKFLW